MAEEMTHPALDRYFARIGHAGPASPTLPTLRMLHRRHAETIPFENLDALLKHSVRLDAPALEEKLLERGRGGYCFEQNALFASVLRALGFRVTCLAARVRWMAPENAATPRTHMLLRVDLPEGPYIADVGFGGLTLTEPLALVADAAQPTSHEAFRFKTVAGEFEMQARLGEEWRSLYRFSLDEQNAADYEVANWFISTHPNSIFTGNLMAARPSEGRRYALMNTDFTVRHLDGRIEQHRLETAAALAEVLSRDFLITLPENAQEELKPFVDAWNSAPRP